MNKTMKPNSGIGSSPLMTHQLTTTVGYNQKGPGYWASRSVAYLIFIVWTLLTLTPLVWMTYSSFKTNAELTQNIFSMPQELLFNPNHEYQISDFPSLQSIADGIPRITLESTRIRSFRHFIPVSQLPPEISSLPTGATLTVNDLPGLLRTRILWRTFFYNYISAWERGNLGPKFINSLIYVVVSTTTIILFSMMASYGFAKMQFARASKILSTMIALGYLLSIPAIIIPLFIMLSNLRLTDTHLGIILVYVAFGLPLGVLLGQGYMRGIPDSIVESAHMDGAGHWRVFGSIILPMTVPVIITVSIINALGIWNEFLLVLVMASSESTKSLPVGVFSFASQTSIELGWQLAALVIAVIPTMTVYFLFNKRITQGVVAGAVKG
jgi:raffinose/stachyose/melibiose transport system permease protein